MSELRYHPFLGQWVITATHRQERTYFPPADFCPLCPTKSGGFPTEIPLPDYEIVVFENKFPSLRINPGPPAIEPIHTSDVRSSAGACEVICYTPRHDCTLADLSQTQVERLIEVWKHRYEELASRPEIEYVFIFENKGKEIGVTLIHPHGQIYAYPFIPPVIETELRNEQRHFELTGQSLMDEWLAEELSIGSRVVFENASFAVVIPFFARYPYETYIVTKRGRPSLAQFDDQDISDLAEALLTTVRKFDGLFGFSLPYIMGLHQAPSRQVAPFTRFHIEFYPPHRTESKLKYLAGSEAGAGAFINDTEAEESAQRLREVEVTLDDPSTSV